jgi:asparagine synthase (glutamine-hydrolysing)
MCGIAGIYWFDRSEDVAPPPDPGPVAAMIGRLRHRGPDDNGILLARGVALGHARLSIIDLAGGRQPLMNETGSIATVFNGEIYNHLDLRPALEAAGHRFATRSDTEAIVHLYEEHWPREGERALARLDGMFGLAIYDRNRHRLVLARDPVGKKPVYYHANARRVVFASELKALLTAPDVPRDVSIAAMDEYLALGYIAAPATIFTGVRKLRPGWCLVCERGEAREAPFYSLDEAVAALRAGRGAAPSAEEAAAEVRRLLERAVARRLMSDVPLGAFLSGGVDSSAVVALMARLAGRVQTFSIGFDEAAYDERADARAIAQRFGTAHTELIVRPDALEALDALVYHFDEPFADSSAVPSYYVAKVARAHVTVALSGDGGDEVFAGYARYFPSRRDRVFLRLPEGVRRRALGWLSRALPEGAPAKRYLGYMAGDALSRYLTRLGICRPDERAALFTDEALAFLSGPPPEARAAPFFAGAGGGAAEFIARCARFDHALYLPEDILVKVDRTSMAVALEARAPLLDRSLAEFVFSLPPEVRLGAGGARGGLAPKALLRRALEGAVLPAEVFEKKKHGFALPVERWLRRELRDLLYDALLSPRARARGYFRPERLRALIAEHESGKNRSEQLWALLWLELWHRRFVDAGATEAVAA